MACTDTPQALAKGSKPPTFLTASWRAASLYSYFMGVLYQMPLLGVNNNFKEMLFSTLT